VKKDLSLFPLSPKFKSLYWSRKTLLAAIAPKIPSQIEFWAGDCVFRLALGFTLTIRASTVFLSLDFPIRTVKMGETIRLHGDNIEFRSEFAAHHPQITRCCKNLHP
jgi:hypothetical protein